MHNPTVSCTPIKIDINQLPFSERDKAYLNQDERIKPYLTDFPSAESIINQAKIKEKHPVDRQLLTQIIQQQYHNANIQPSQDVSENIKALEDVKTFTIITAHQPSLLTGPLYYIFKILSCINTCQHLNSHQDEYQFVPVFVSGGEDHDFDEIATLNLFGKSVTWKSEQTGSVGRMSLDGIDEVLAEITEILGPRSQALDLISEFEGFAKQSKTYGEFQFKIVNHLFGKYGLVCFSSDSPVVKDSLLPLFQKELEGSISSDTVIPQQEKIKSDLGYDAQAYVRPINLFYLSDGMRERIEQNGDEYHVLNSGITFKNTDIPDITYHLSPNVVMRPLTQEYLFPNVAYLGGGGELAYWIERKTQFEAFGIPYPILIRRNSAGIMRSKDLQKWEALGFTTDHLFDEEHLVTDLFIANQREEISLEEERKSISESYQAIALKAANINPSLEKAVYAIAAKETKQLEQLESRLKREVKKQYENDLSKIAKLQSQVTPNNKLQERHENILTYLSKYGTELIDVIKNNLDPLEDKFTLLILD